MDFPMNSSDGTPDGGNEAEESQPYGAIEKLSMDLGVPLEEVSRLYWSVLKRFEKDSKIRPFLPVLVRRRVAHLLEKRRNGKRVP